MFVIINSITDEGNNKMKTRNARRGLFVIKEMEMKV